MSKRRWALGAKRMIDLGVSLASLAVLAVPLAGVAVWVKLDSRGPVFFRQKRPGKNRTPFRVWKFRTMHHRPESQRPEAPPLSGDPRVTRAGRFLRRSGVDELPQLVNVLLGQMSLVGPRPTLWERAEGFSSRHQRRFEMKPGITGLALVSGRNRLTWDEKAELDVVYVERFTLAMDLRILLKTPWVLLHGEGVFMDPGDAMPSSIRSGQPPGFR